MAALRKAILALALLLFGVPMALAGLLLGLGTWIRLIEWF